MSAARPEPTPARREGRGSPARAVAPRAVAPGEVAPGAGGRPGETEADPEEESGPPAPWHFKVLLFGTAGYLVYRLIWFIFWLTGHAWHG